jgi:hypothetical protein
MTVLSTSWEMTDAAVTRAVREDLLSFARKHWKIRDLLVIAASTLIFARAVATGAHWLWWLAGVPAALFILLWLAWLGAFLVWPRIVRARLKHLPHRTMTLEMGPELIAIASATEKLEVRWSELTTIKELAGFWILCFRAGARVPVPVEAVEASMASCLRQAQARLLARMGRPAEDA